MWLPVCAWQGLRIGALQGRGEWGAGGQGLCILQHALLHAVCLVGCTKVQTTKCWQHSHVVC